MEYLGYAKFLPRKYLADPLIAPEPTWWEWRGRRVHVARARDSSAPVRVLGVHGLGGHAGLLWVAAGVGMREGMEVMAIDLPLYGDTVEADPGAVRYADWVDMLCEFVCAETESDDRPLVLFGASMGGMVAYEVAARTGRVAQVMATCLSDPADPAARRASARWSFTGGWGPKVLAAVAPILGNVRVPIRWLVDMRNMSLDPELSRMCATDPRGGGVRVPLGLLGSFLSYRHFVPEEFTATPVTLVHPAADRWTPPELSIRFPDRVGAPTRVVLLEGCGHFPIEEPGVTRMVEVLREVVDSAANRTS
ncbi:alpha/beta hydrolase [Nocardia sp. NBC_01377]|uniref:alpha/beta hydrolase n=1 Tax=Nocardia sp. NBC_01377 TaxID=2903595 RepID=UPI003243645A